MRQSIRALGWAVTISMLLLLVFVGTAVYSVSQSVLIGRGIEFGEFQMSFSDNELVFSMPIKVNNTGYFDMSEFNVTTTLKDCNGTTLTTKSTFIGEIKRGLTESRLHNLSLSLADILSNMTRLLFHDTEFKVDFTIGFKYASALGLQLSTLNMSMPWGAPLYGLNLKEVSSPSFNGTHLLANATLEVENHSFLDVAGHLTIRVYNETGEYLGSGDGLVYVASGSRLSEQIEAVINIVNPLSYTGKGYMEIYLELPMFDHVFELGRVDYG